MAMELFFGVPVGLLGAGYIFTYDLDNNRFIPIDMNVARGDRNVLGRKIHQKYFSTIPLVTLSPRNLESVRNVLLLQFAL